MTTSTLLGEAIAAVKAGQRQYARELLLELVEQEPAHELAWLWLSGLLESREDQIKALENSITISESGGKPDVLSRLHVIGSRGAAPIQAQFRSAIKALDSGKHTRARSLLKQILAEDKNHERAWMALSRVAEDAQEQISALENVLRLNPNNIRAREALGQVKNRLYQQYLNLGHLYQRQAKHKQAVEAYKLAERYASVGTFRAAARQRWQLIESKTMKQVTEDTPNPSLIILRLAIGPPILYALLILMQSGLRPLQIDVLHYAGGLIVILGSLMAATSTHAPHHPIWVSIWGPTAATDEKKKARLRNLGVLIMLIPFILWLVGAIWPIAAGWLPT